ncbi:cytochrome b/b6 domain-containing protein [Yoonia sp. SS1-5]|uniref:Cytochrome b/b6 domain-containing protein n=1 Tax=Yoonia rhodophyticola TaxID=3137370 RepID=A0AAN0NHC6_9RHOB
MSTANTQTVYGSVTKTFHWLTALLIITIIPLGAIANRLPFETDAQIALKATLFSLHKTLGIIVFAVALGRIIWAITQTKPGPLHPERKAETLLAEIVHWLLYVSLVAVPLTGWIHHAATTGFAPILLPIGQGLPLVGKDEGTAELFAGLHWIWSKIMVGAILLHIAGALKHQIIDKDATLRRMWFGQSETPAVGPHHSSLAPPLAAVLIYAAATAAGAGAGILSHQSEQGGPALDAVASQWQVTNGEIAITVAQLGSPVTGSFEDWTSSITFDPDAQGKMGEVTTTIAITSLKLGSVSDQAMGADFFDATTFPTAVFQADIVQDGDGLRAEGTLRIKENEMPVSLPFDLTIAGDDAEMSGGTTLDRRDFAIGQSMSDESSLGFNVEVLISLNATRTAE